MVLHRVKILAQENVFVARKEHKQQSQGKLTGQWVRRQNSTGLFLMNAAAAGHAHRACNFGSMHVAKKVFLTEAPAFNERPCLAVLISTWGAQEESPWVARPLTAMRTRTLPLQQPLAHGPGQVGSSRAGHPAAQGSDPSERSQHHFAGRWCASHEWSGRSLHSLAWCAEIHACTHGRMQELAAVLSYTGWLPAWSRLQGQGLWSPERRLWMTMILGIL